MRFHPLRHLAAVGVALLFIPFTTFAIRAQIAQTTRTSTTGVGSSVRGRIVYGDNGQPLKGVTVVVFRTDSNDPLTTTTNQLGEYRLDGLSKGKYYITLEGPGVPAPSGVGMQIPLPVVAIPRPEDYPEVIPKHDAAFTADGMNTVDVDIRVVRGGTISGRVLKPDGTPVPGVAVHILSRGNNAGPYSARFSAPTDKKGIFRIENIPPADYVVAASAEDKKGNYDVRARVRGESQVVTFHPAAIRLSDALPVHVDSGRESSGVDITLVERTTLQVSGKLILGRDGSGIAGANVVLRAKDSEQLGPLVPGMAQRMTTTASDGTWSFSNVSPGEYEVTALSPLDGAVRGARPMPQAPPPDRTGRPILRSGSTVVPLPRPRYSIVQQQLGLITSDVEGITLTLRGTGRIRGIVETDNGGPLPRGLTLFFEFGDNGGRPSRPQPAQVLPDGSFVLDGVPAGEQPISVALPSGSQYFVVSATAGGEDLTKGLSIIEDTEGATVRVEISTKYAQVSGRVKASQNDQSLVVLFLPVEASKWRFRTAHTALLVGADGSFSGKVPPGEYIVIGRPRNLIPMVITRSFIESLGAERQQVTLTADERKVLEIPIQQ